MMTEILIGRKTQKSAVGALKQARGARLWVHRRAASEC